MNVRLTDAEVELLLWALDWGVTIAEESEDADKRIPELEALMEKLEG